MSNEKSLPLFQIIKKKPIRYQWLPDGRLVFEFPDGDRVFLCCDKCQGVIWDNSCVLERDEKGEEQLVFRSVCHSCGKMSLMFITRKELEYAFWHFTVKS